MARTTRIPNTWASPGAVRQHGGDRPVYRCNACGSEVVWLESQRTGRRYLADVQLGYYGQRFYIGRRFHRRDCAEQRQEQIEALRRDEARARIGADLADLASRAGEAHDRGDLAERDRIIAEMDRLTAGLDAR